MRCIICKHGDTDLGVTTVTLEKGGATIVFKNVPAHICQNCGEKYVDDAIVKELLKQAEEIYKSGAQVDIRDYTLAA